jgi:hypothetical protein
VAAALAGAGRELEPGLDRISGRWDDRDRGLTSVETAWTPSDAAPLTPSAPLDVILAPPAIGSPPESTPGD